MKRYHYLALSTATALITESKASSWRLASRQRP